MIGGQGEKKTLRLMAQYADMANFTSGFDEIPRKLEVLEQHCADVGRDPATINKTPLCSVAVGSDDGGRGGAPQRVPLGTRPRLGHPGRTHPSGGGARLIVGDADTVGGGSAR